MRGFSLVGSVDAWRCAWLSGAVAGSLMTSAGKYVKIVFFNTCLKYSDAHTLTQLYMALVGSLFYVRQIFITLFMMFSQHEPPSLFLGHVASFLFISILLINHIDLSLSKCCWLTGIHCQQTSFATLSYHIHWPVIKMIVCTAAFWWRTKGSVVIVSRLVILLHAENFVTLITQFYIVREAPIYKLF